jgi:hypothetical protein
MAINYERDDNPVDEMRTIFTLPTPVLGNAVVAEKEEVLRIATTNM